MPFTYDFLKKLFALAILFILVLHFALNKGDNLKINKATNCFLSIT